MRRGNRVDREQVCVEVHRLTVAALRRLSYQRDVPMTALVREGINLVLAKYGERKNDSEG